MRDAPDFATTFSYLREGAWAYAALAAAVELGLLDHLREPTTLDAVLDASGIECDLVEEVVAVLVSIGALEREGRALAPSTTFELYLSPSLRSVFEAEVRSDHLQTGEMLRRLRDGEDPAGWAHTDPQALVSQGETGGLFGLIAECVLPSLSGLGGRLSEPGCEFLDVGAGVGVIASELCRTYPGLRAVGLEPHRVARELGATRIAAAGLGDRIDLRSSQIEDLEAVDRFDLAFMPQPFLSSGSFEAGLERIERALKPGGWLMILTLDLPEDEPVTSSARRFRAGVWGGGVIAIGSLVERLERLGFDEVRIDPPVGAFRNVNARRSLAPRPLESEVSPFAAELAAPPEED